LAFYFLEGMTMRYHIMSALAAGLVFAASSATWAAEIVRLGGPSAESTIQGATDTELVRGYGRGSYGGGYGRGYYGGGYGRGYYGGGYGRGYYGGHYGGYGRGYYGGYYGGYGRGYYGGHYGHYHQPYYYGSYYGGYRPYYSNYYSPYYGNYYSSYYGNSYYGSPYYYGIAYDGYAVAPMTTLQATVYPQTQIAPPQPYAQPQMPPASDSGNGTYPYNGGPANPIPQPSDSPVPMNSPPRGIVPLDGKLVSLPVETTGDVSVVPSIQRWTYVSTAAAPARITYPAYGDVSIPPAPRKTANR